MKKCLFLAATAFAAILGSNAQINAPTPEGYLFRAGEMYAAGNYYGCLDQILAIDDSRLTSADREQARYIRAVATVHTDPSAAVGLIEGFLADYPQSVHYNDALMALGDCYYGTNYNKALSIYNEVYQPGLSPALSEDLTYRMAYCYLMRNNYGKALPLFEQLAGSSVYGNASLFYRGYIAYAKADYRQAEILMQQADSDTAPGNMADYYLSQIYFVRGQYDKALSMAKNLLKRTGIADAYVAEANRIAGEASYAQGDDTQAIKYLEKYVSMVEVPLPSASYILGIDAYSKGDYPMAIEYLTKVTGHDDAMGQSAYLYLGQAYMHQDDYTPAAMAFNRALNMDYDSDVRETAYYNYAIASLNGGRVPFASTVKIFSDFLRLYPESQYAPDVQEYIITSYITDNNYKGALASINEMKRPSAATLVAKQRVLYVLGTKALASGEYPQAQVYLTESKALAKHNPQIANEVLLSLGEAYYNNGEYAKAVAELKNYISHAKADAKNLPLAHYDLGYAQFALKHYADASKEFEKVVAAPGDFTNATLADAYCRLGDCRYFAKDFEAAADAYSDAYSRNKASGDYPLYQTALMLGYQRQYNQKIITLTRLEKEFATSALIPDALLEMTESYIQLGETSKAIDVYTKLVEKYPNTRQGRQGYLQMALVKLNSGHTQAAISDYKELIRLYPTSDEAQQAVEQMKRLAAESGQLKDFQAFLQGIDKAPKLDASEVEQLMFEDAEKDFLTRHNTAKLAVFVESYPQSNNTARALSYLIEGEYGAGNAAKAYDYAVTLVEHYPSSSYAQPALIVKAQVEEAQGKGNLALRTWRQLQEVASTPANLLTARMGVIRNAREAGLNDEVVEAAKAVVATSGVDADLLAEARYSLGFALNKTGNTKGARKAWEEAAPNTGLLYGIMSAHALGESNYKAKSYQQAEKWAKAVANADSPHTYWIARGFILLSDVYAAQGDKYKARQYLEAVRDNYTGSEPDIFEMIDQRLK